MSERKKKGRDISGILIIDKPLHLSSNQVVQRVKRLFGAKKTGHTGSLDPLASGVLPICLGHATKISQYLLTSDKTYQFTMQLGQSTTTGDTEGEVVIEQPVPCIEESELNKVLRDFIGEISQIPPMYSALKHNGQRLYDLARAGQIVERPSRTVCIKSLKVLSREATSITLEVCCSKGTYVRTLAEDLAEKLGCVAHVTFLRRITTGPFDLTSSVTLDQVDALQGNLESLDKLLGRLDSALLEYPVISCTDAEKGDLCLGRKIEIKGLQQHSLIRLNDSNGEIFGLAKWSENDYLAPTRIFA